MPIYAVNKAVSGLEFNLQTSSSSFYPTGTQEFDSVEESLDNYHVLVWVETETTFNGDFFYCAASGTFSNIIASDFYGNEITGVSIYLSGEEPYKPWLGWRSTDCVQVLHTT